MYRPVFLDLLGFHRDWDLTRFKQQGIWPLVRSWSHGGSTILSHKGYPGYPYWWLHMRGYTTWLGIIVAYKLTPNDVKLGYLLTNQYDGMRTQAGFSWLGPEVMWVHLSRSYGLSKEVCKIFGSTLDGYPENTLISWTMGIASQVGQPIASSTTQDLNLDVLEGTLSWTPQATGLCEAKLVGAWNMAFIFSINIYIYVYIGNVIIPTDELIFFRGVGLNHQPENLLEFLLFVSKKQGSCGI